MSDDHVCLVPKLQDDIRHLEMHVQLLREERDMALRALTSTRRVLMVLLKRHGGPVGDVPTVIDDAELAAVNNCSRIAERHENNTLIFKLEERKCNLPK